MPRQPNPQPIPSPLDLVMGSLTLLMLLAVTHFLAFIL